MYTNVTTSTIRIKISIIPESSFLFFVAHPYDHMKCNLAGFSFMACVSSLQSKKALPI